MGEPRFLADRMLAKLARWLALMGYDARRAADGEVDDAELMRHAQREGRVLLTRDRRMPPVAGAKVLVLRSEGHEEQLAEVLRTFSLRPDPARFFSRCAPCDALLVPAAYEDVAAELPERVRTLETLFYRCPACRRLYWTGTHVERIRGVLLRLGSSW